MRPPGWRCPYLGKKANRYYELGADAYEEGLKKEALYSLTDECMVCKAGVNSLACLEMTSHRKGYLVFIPDEEEK